MSHFPNLLQAQKASSVWTETVLSVSKWGWTNTKSALSDTNLVFTDINSAGKTPILSLCLHLIHNTILCYILGHMVPLISRRPSPEPQTPLICL